MILITLLVINLILAIAETNSDVGYCDASAKTCGEHSVNNDDERLIFYDVNPGEGFNLRRDVYMRFAIMLAEARKKGKNNWKLVLPPWYDLYHWKWDRGIPRQWNMFFDINSLNSFAPVVEIHDVFKKVKGKVLEIDTLYILQNFEDAFENGIFKEKWEIVASCENSARFWGYENITAKEVLCVQFQGKASKLWELISMHPSDKKVMFHHGEIALHDNYGTKTFWDCRKSMKFNKSLVKIAKNYISQNLNCDTTKCKNYLSVHWRRQDFARGRGDDVPTVSGTAKQIRKILKTLSGIKKIFIATDASMTEINDLKSRLVAYKYEIHLFLASPAVVEEYKDGGLAIIDQIICSHAAYFIGTHESTFTYRIQEEREILGFDSNTTFNRFCPDVGYCEKPSKWTIVNNDAH